MAEALAGVGAFDESWHISEDETSILVDLHDAKVRVNVVKG